MMTAPALIRKLGMPVAAMALVVLASNYLVQFPVQAWLGAINLADILTWGAFTYPVAFLVTDLTNRRYGPQTARRVVFAGFILAVILSVWLATPRIAIASGTAFLVAHLLDVHIFDRMRRATWWQAPLASSVLGSVVDTILFFGLAFSVQFAFLGANDTFAIELAPFLSIFQVEVPRWLSWAVGDLGVKLLVALTLLAPYRLVAPFIPMKTQDGVAA